MKRIVIPGYWDRQVEVDVLESNDGLLIFDRSLYPHQFLFGGFEILTPDGNDRLMVASDLSDAFFLAEKIHSFDVPRNVLFKKNDGKVSGEIRYWYYRRRLLDSFFGRSIKMYAYFLDTGFIGWFPEECFEYMVDGKVVTHEIEREI